MISPSPTRPKPDSPAPEENKNRPLSTPRKRAGQKPLALFIKGLLRPIFKGIYYFMSFVRSHRLVSLIVLILLLASIAITSYVTTGRMPFSPPPQQSSGLQQTSSNPATDVMQQWLTALRKGDVSTLKVLDNRMPNPPDPNLLVSQFSQTSTRTWQSMKLIGANQESDTTVDTFVEVDLSETVNGTAINTYLIWHFVIVPTQKEAILYSVDFVDNRQSLQ
ncbi:MAG TPA: hypothetical protein VKV37_02445 [Ktedonobacteraceae bacterium]|jgi:hypothetical protein|nr:hypothetical protein [Ktedonobacteraceae bacterium]